VKKRGWAVWITGPPASSKTTVAEKLKERLGDESVPVQILESDTLKRVLTPNPTYTAEERETFHTSMAYIGVLLTQNGVNVIFDATANKRRWRRAARGLIDNFLQVRIRCPIEVCRERDQKGVYMKAEEGEEEYAWVVQEEYEEPWHVDVELDCVKDSPEASAEKIMEALKENDLI
jgi:adenylylsulfate kinase